MRFTRKMFAMHSNCGDATPFFLNLNKGKVIMQMFHLVWHTIRGVAIHSIIINVCSFKAPVKPSKYLNKTFIELLNRTLLVVVVGRRWWCYAFHPFWSEFEYMMRVFELFISCKWQHSDRKFCLLRQIGVLCAPVLSSSWITSTMLDPFSM